MAALIDLPSSPRLRALADAYPDGMLGVEAGHVTVVNAQAAALLGGNADDMLGRPLDEVLQLQDQEGHTWLAVNRPYDAISIVRGVPEQTWLNNSGEEVLTTARLIRAKHLGPVTQLAIALRSGRGRARLDRERSDLVATVAHELRSPLTGVRGFVQALLNRWDRLNDDQRKLMLMTVASDADRLARLIAELLDVARIDTDRLQLYPRPSSAAVLVGRVVASIEAGTARTLRFEPGDVPDIFADPDKFTQVVTNLIENAVKHGEGQVSVRLESVDHGGPAVRLVVEDEGAGIPVELRRRVFTKFWTTGESGGTGLGMYIVGGLTRAHGGLVTIDDAPGGGARVSVDWPCDDRRPDR